MATKTSLQQILAQERSVSANNSNGSNSNSSALKAILAKGTPVPAGQTSSGSTNNSSTPPAQTFWQKFKGNLKTAIPGANPGQTTAGTDISAPNVQKARQDAVGALPMVGSIAGGIGGAALGGLVASPTILGVPAAAYAGGVAGAGLGAAAGKAGLEAIQGGGIKSGQVAKTGAEYAAGEAIGVPAAGKIAEIASPIIKGVLDTLSESSAGKTLSKIIQDVSPKMSSKETAEAIAQRGGVKKGFLGRIEANIDPEIKRVAGAVKKEVPDFTSQTTFTGKVNAVRKAVYGMADDLKQKVVASGQDKIFPFKELAAKMDDVEKPIAIKADTTLDKQFDLAKDAAMKIVQKSGGKVSDLLDARKSFDQLVQKQFPTLYDRANAPMRDAITSMRNVMNDFIAKNLPDVGYKDSLKSQSQLFKAIDNLSEKASGEVGTTGLGRLIENHPTATKIGKYALGALGVGAFAGAGENIAKDIIP